MYPFKAHTCLRGNCCRDILCSINWLIWWSALSRINWLIWWCSCLVRGRTLWRIIWWNWWIDWWSWWSIWLKCYRRWLTFYIFASAVITKVMNKRPNILKPQAMDCCTLFEHWYNFRLWWDLHKRVMLPADWLTCCHKSMISVVLIGYTVLTVYTDHVTIAESQLVDSTCIHTAVGTMAGLLVW